MGAHSTTLAPERCTITIRVAFDSSAKSEPMRRLEAAVAEIEADVRELSASPSTPITQYTIDAPSARTWRPWNTDGEVQPPRHEAATDIRVEFRDFREMSQWVAACGERDGCTIREAKWDLNEDTRLSVEARTLTAAIQDARDRAQLIAEAAGFCRVEFLEIADPGLLDGARAIRGFEYAGSVGSALLADDAGVTIAPEDIEVAATVHARFRAS